MQVRMAVHVGFNVRGQGIADEKGFFPSRYGAGGGVGALERRGGRRWLAQVLHRQE